MDKPESSLDENSNIRDEDWDDESPVDRQKADVPAFVLRLDAYEGPIDVLLELARSQKVDLTEISILQLVDQFLAFMREAKRLNLSLAADYLIMAAWLAYLKSRLLVPVVTQEGEEETEDLAALLTFRLQQLSAMREAANQLLSLPRLAVERFAGPRDGAVEIRQNVRVQASLFDLLKAYSSIHARREGRRHAVPKIEVPFTFDAAIKRLSRILPGLQNLTWTSLQSFLPTDLSVSFERRSATASYFSAALELNKRGIVHLQQSGEYADIMIKTADLKKLSEVAVTADTHEDTEVWDLKAELDQAQGVTHE